MRLKKKSDFNTKNSFKFIDLSTILLFIEAIKNNNKKKMIHVLKKVIIIQLHFINIYHRYFSL